MNTVYLIQNTVNSKIYVGVTSMTLEQRLKRHIYAARAGKQPHLQRAIRKHGENAFEIYPLQDAKDKEKAYKLEKYWVELLNTYEGNHGYNMMPGGKNGAASGKNHPMYGWKHSKETLRKVAENNSNLTKQEAGEVKWIIRNTDVKQEDIANYYSITCSTTSHLKTGKTLQHINPQRPSTARLEDLMSNRTKDRRRDPETKGKLSRKQAGEVKYLTQNDCGLTQNAIARKYGVSQGIVSRIKHEKRWPNLEPSNPFN